jgi:DNA mismatch endonuclease (patch repair protein)
MEYKEPKIIVPRFNEVSGFYTTKKRSKIMSKIKGKNSKPELLFRKALWTKGIRYRINNKSLPGKPDISIKNTS